MSLPQPEYRSRRSCRVEKMSLTIRAAALASLLCLVLPPALHAQEATPPSSSGTERRDSLPYVNLYLPEGQASVRLRKLIRNVLFESQIDYKFVTGDISTFLRYKYYARNFTYKIAVFDSIGFEGVLQSSSLDFQRVRGGLVLFEVPKNYNERYFLLFQDDRLTFGDSADADNRKNNIYTKIAYQYGTPFDERMNEIVGESRGRITPVLTAFREIGPQKTGLALAMTESARLATGDYRYTKLEGEALRRWDLSPTSFVVTRFHLGTVLGKQDICHLPTAPATCIDNTIAEVDRFSVPRYEMFKLGGREALKGVKDTASLGTDEVHLTNEYFVPVFRNRDFRSWVLHWNTLYGIGYLGVGNVGFSPSDIVRSTNAVVDAGLGTEASLTVRDFEVLLSVVVARPIHAPSEFKGNSIRFSIKTVR
jgi:hypothetical protein